MNKNQYHCHLSRKWIACWENEKGSLTIEVYYAGSRENAHIEINIKGNIPPTILSILQKEYGEEVKIRKDEDRLDIFESEWYKKTKKNITPGENIRIYRENSGLTQAELGEKLGGIARQNISNMERGRRNISLNIAKKLARILDTSIEKFV